MIEVQNVNFGYGREPVLTDVSLRMNNGEVVGFIGPNGAGKSTLLRLCARLLKPQAGHILVDEKQQYDAKAFARQLAFLPQSRPIPAMTVRSLVMMGRFAHGRGDQEAVERALHAVGLKDLAGRDVRSLSGGQRQMAYLAMLLSQESPNVLLDEPLTHLDIGSQLDAADVIGRMRDEGRCVAVVLHDLHMLDKICDRAVLLDHGKITFDGDPQECLRSQALQQAFGVQVLEQKGITFVKR